MLIALLAVVSVVVAWCLYLGALVVARRREQSESLEIQVLQRTQELEEASSLQRAILSHAGYAIVATDATGTIKAFNPAAEKLLGYSADELVGRAKASIFHEPREVAERARGLSEETGKDILPNHDFFVAKVRREPMYEEEWTYVRRDGSRVPVLTSVTALRNREGDVMGMLGIALDRTDHERQQQALLRAKEQADAANRAKSAFLANMSHEIRTPMNAVLGMIQLLGRTELSARQSDYVAKANSAARSLVGVIDDILDISKIEAGKLTLETETFRVDELLDEVANMLNTRLEGKPVEFLFRVGMTVPANLEGDVLRLKQVLVNLLGNAFKFTDEGEVILSVEVAEHDDERMAVRFEVADTGIGMSPEHQQRVFDSFTQAEAGTSRRFGGTGLGLAISRSLVELMGGELWVESDLGVGSTFGFTLELGRSRQAATPTSDTLQLLATELRSLRILLVDDQPTARTVLTEMLESLGWSVEACSSGFEAVERLRTGTADGRPCDLALVDWQMPELDGWQTAGALRDVDGFRTLPIVAMIPACCQEELAQRQDHDASRLDSVLVKPMTPSALLRCVARIFAGGAADRETARARGQIGDGRALAGLRLLVVEDNAVNRQVAEQLLRGEGATVEAVASGRRALDRIRRLPAVDAVLMDIQMPGLDGLETTRRIRRQLGETSLPILAMTANSLQSDRDAALAAGMDDHVGKPVEIGRLVQMILLHCGRGSGGVRRSGPPDSGPFDEPEGFSLRKAAQQLGNDTLLLGELAGRFASDLEGEADEIADGFGAGRYRETAARLHTLRGVAATLGADALASAAADLELAARESCSPGPDRLEAFGCHCETARRVLAEVQKDVAAGIGAPKARCGNDSPKVDVAPKMRSLESLLSDHNMRAVDVHAEIRTLLPELGAELSSELEQAMDRLDFTVARDRLHQLMQSAQLVRSVAPESH